MGKPYGDLPHHDPTRLTDSAEEYAAPSEAAMEAAKEWLKSAASVPGIAHKLAMMFDAFAAQAVAAERARLAVAISRAFYALPSSNGHEIKGQEQMCIAAINLVKAE